MNETICVCGAGTMGRGIAQAAALSGIYTVLYELQPKALDMAVKELDKSLQEWVTKNKISAVEKEKAMNHIRFTGDLQSCLADIFIEAIVEDESLKVALFNQLAEINHSESVFASNTSSLSLTSIASRTRNPERVIGMHFFNPPAIMKLVEVVKTKYTNEATLRAIHSLAKTMRKITVDCHDSPGFIVNRVARPFYIESLRILEEGQVEINVIDELMESSGFRMGPFRLMDLIGNDINYTVSCSVYDQMGKPERLRPSNIQKEKVEKGELGRKTKKGYYEYK